MADAVKECYSCGKEADPNSPRNFCTECDAHFAEGERHQEVVYTRAYLLEEAKFKGETDRVSELMTDIFKESAIAESKAAGLEAARAEYVGSVAGLERVTSEKQAELMPEGIGSTATAKKVK